MRLASAGLLVLLGGCQWLLGLKAYPEPGPDAVVVPGTWAHVAAGRYFTCAIDLTQNLYCWGYNGDNELGMGGPAQHETPTLVAGASWTQVTAGTLYACGIQLDGTLWCWGSNYVGQLGDGTTNDANQPRQIGTKTWKSVAAFEDTTCAIDMTDQLFCWGDNSHGAAGVGDTTAEYHQPTPVMAGTTWQAVAPGSDHTCALMMDQHVFCWGANWDGQVGNGVTGPDVFAPVGVTGTFVSIAAGNDFSCGVGTDGRIRCWGNNAYGQLGDGTTTKYNTPHPATSTVTDFTAVHAGETVACALRANGALFCWGDATPGPLAMAATTPTAVAAPIGAWTELAVGHRHTCGIGTVHDLWCAGDGSTGALGNGMAGPRQPVMVASGMTSIAAGGDTTCAIGAGSKVQCWGANSTGQLGNGLHVRSLAPTPISSDETWMVVSVGDAHACGITPNGTRCWGDHGLGNGNPDDARQPTPITPDPGFVAIAAGGDHTCGLTQAMNNVYCWGANDYGQLGLGNTSPQETVMQVTSRTFKNMDLGKSSTCALDMTSHRLTCAGLDDKAQLANGVGGMQTSFVASGDATAYDHVVLGAANGCALDGAGAAACWGRNDFGETGGTMNPVPTPTRLPGTSWHDLALGSEFTCGVLTSSEVVCWGRNDYGQLGDGSITNSRTAVSVQGLPNTVNYVTAGDAHACALTSIGEVWCWGKNDDGQVGTDAGWAHTFLEVPAPQ